MVFLEFGSLVLNGRICICILKKLFLANRVFMLAEMMTLQALQELL